MSTGEVFVWCVGIVCGTILVGAISLAIILKPDIEIKKDVDKN